MRAARRLSLFGFLFIPLLAFAACGDGGPDLDTNYPPAGEDRFDNTTATVEIEITLPGVGALPVALGERETIELEGPMVVNRSDPQDKDGDGLVDIETEIISMELQGEGSMGPIVVRQSADRPSLGEVEQQEPGQDTPADSFFDIFLKVEILDIGLIGFNDEAIRMEAELIEFPPGFRDQYEGALALPTPLLSADSKEEFALILDALHIPNPPPSPAASPAATPKATPTPTPEATPTEAPTPTEEAAAQQVTVSVQAGCEHTQPGVQSDLVALVLAALVGAAPVEGATIDASASGPGILEGTASAVTDASGAAELRFPINQFGEYDISVDHVTGPDGAPLEIDPASQTSTSFEVGEVCTLP